MGAKPAAQAALEVADWRRRVFGIYEEVRRLSAERDVLAAHRYWRESRDDLFASHPQTPLLPEDRPGFAGLPVAEYDPAWRFTVEITPPAEPARFDFETGTDGVVPFDLLGRAEVPGVGSLDVWRLMSYGGGLFIPVRDALASAEGRAALAASAGADGVSLSGGGRASRAQTYGGGRYLLDTIKGAFLGAGESATSLVLDFNYSYNPSCAYDPAWACPLAPAGNRVATPIPVGELYGV